MYIFYLFGYVYGVMDIGVMDTVTRVQILDEAVCISHNANILGKSMSPTTPPSATGKIVGQFGLFNLDMANSLKEGKL